MELTAAVQKYAWGKVGKSSLVAQLAQSNESFTVSDKDNYAELWMGTHPNGPSKIIDSNQSLDDLIKSDPSVLGAPVYEKFGPNLPFLLKVLSVETALSIQAHPDLQLGSVLHSTQPQLYKDPNHKPEMAIAVTEFEVMCGFRSLPAIVNYLKNVPELRTIVGEEAAAQLEANLDKDSLKNVFTQLMNSDEKLVASQLDSLISRLGPDLDESDLIGRLAKQYPGDIGIFCVFFLQHLKLSPGEAIFLPANEPHAYIYGDCVECMASSDNVVRAGLTPKFKDVNTLTEMLTYEAGKDWVVRGSSIENNDSISAVLYDAPVPEFSIIKYNVKSKSSLKSKGNSCSIILCTEGTGSGRTSSGKDIKIKPGSSIFLPSQSLEIEIVPDSTNLTLYEAYSTL